MRSSSILSTGLRAGVLALAPAVALASMGNLGTTYGLLPSDVASAQALSMFNTQVSSVYYNPAYLTHDLRGELTAGLMHVESDLQANSQNFGSYDVQDTDSQQILLGLKTDLSDITEFGQPIALGIMLGTEKYGKEMLAFSSRTAPTGQYFRGGRQPLFLNVGVGTKIFRGLDFGASILVTLRSSAELVANTDLAGNTDYESLDVTAKPTLRPILSLNMDWGETFCPDGQCWYNGMETAFTFRGHSDASVAVKANTIIPGTIPDPGLFINIATVDAYQPNIYALGTQIKHDRWRVGLTVEMQQWSDLEDELVNDTVKQNSGLEFKDIVIPRIGLEYQLTDMVGITAGVAFEESPLDSTDNPNVNYLDADRTVFGLGLTSTFDHVYGMRYPVRVDFGYQYHLLDKREFHVTSDQTGNDDYVETDGEINVFGGSISMKF